VRPERDDIAAPVLPGRPRWLNTERDPVMAELTASGPVLVHFFDFAQVNSLRALPYVIAWDERYREAGLATLGIHSPRFSFTKDGDLLAPALERLGISHPVVDDSGYVVWHDYGCEGWPSLFLWAQGGALDWFHFGEGDYAATEAAIATELARIDPHFEAPAPLRALRLSDAPGAVVVPPSGEIFPGGSVTEPWRSDGGAIGTSYGAGGVHASVDLDGPGELRVSIDGAPPRTIAVAAPGLVELAAHPAHEEHELRLEADPGLAVYSVSFSAGVP
jgi:Thioredoxin like C-terminal domain